ncbi:hypothetical protein M8J76_001680 [Diaphorina citri]|nr:hypothetical protein M8J76_001680 [Diaphorina citri]
MPNDQPNNDSNRERTSKTRLDPENEEDASTLINEGSHINSNKKETNNSKIEDENEKIKINEEVNKLIDQALAELEEEANCDNDYHETNLVCENVDIDRSEHKTNNVPNGIIQDANVVRKIPTYVINTTLKPNGTMKDVNLNGEDTPEISVTMTCVLPKGMPIYKTKNLDFDDVLPHLGEFGRYQKVLFFSMILFAFAEAFVYFSQIFITVIPEHYWCRVPELSHLDFEQRKLISIPQTGAAFDSCRMYAVNYTHLLGSGITKADPSWPIVECQHGWDYDHSDIPYTTIATEDTLSTWAQAFFFCGAIVGGLVFGWVADRFGRVPALVLTNLVGFIFGVITAFTKSFWQFALCRFFVGLSFDNCFTMMYILVLEYVGPNWRTFVANMSIAVFFTLAETLLPWIAYYVANWKWLCIVTSLPLLLGVFIAWIVPESARWLVSQGRVDEAVIIMKKFEKINKKQESCQRLAEQEKDQKRYSVLDLFKTARLRNVTCLLIIIWMALSLLFDGHVRQVENLGTNFFITFSLASATEFPADTLLTFTLDTWGRRWYACITMVLSGVFSLMSCSLETGTLSVGFALVGRFLVNISYNIGLQYAAEVLPTVLRGQGVALIHTMGFVASILSPFIVYLAVINPMLPLGVLGIVGIVAGVLCLFLPETMGKDLPQTMQDFENFGRDQKFLDFPCARRESHEEADTIAESYIKRNHTGDRGLHNSPRLSTHGSLSRESLKSRSLTRRNLDFVNRGFGEN